MKEIVENALKDITAQVEETTNKLLQLRGARDALAQVLEMQKQVELEAEAAKPILAKRKK